MNLEKLPYSIPVGDPLELLQDCEVELVNEASEPRPPEENTHIRRQLKAQEKRR